MRGGWKRSGGEAGKSSSPCWNVNAMQLTDFNETLGISFTLLMELIKDDERGYLSNIPFPLGTHLSGNVTVIPFLSIILMLN